MSEREDLEYASRMVAWGNGVTSSINQKTATLQTAEGAKRELQDATKLDILASLDADIADSLTGEPTRQEVTDYFIAEDARIAQEAQAVADAEAKVIADAEAMAIQTAEEQAMAEAAEALL